MTTRINTARASTHARYRLLIPRPMVGKRREAEIKPIFRLFSHALSGDCQHRGSTHIDSMLACPRTFLMYKAKPFCIFNTLCCSEISESRCAFGIQLSARTRQKEKILLPHLPIFYELSSWVTFITPIRDENDVSLLKNDPTNDI